MCSSQLFLVHFQFSALKQDYLTIAFQSKKEGKNQESIQSSTTTDPGYQ